MFYWCMTAVVGPKRVSGTWVVRKVPKSLSLKPLPGPTGHSQPIIRFAFRAFLVTEVSFDHMAWPLREPPRYPTLCATPRQHQDNLNVDMNDITGRVVFVTGASGGSVLNLISQSTVLIWS